MDLVMISPIDRLDAVDIVGKYLSVETQGMTVKSDVSAGTWERRWSGGFKTDFTRFKWKLLRELFLHSSSNS